MDIPGYRDLTAAGQGEFDDRYRAVDDATGAVVTIRAMRGAVNDERLARRLEREVATSERIGAHPHVVAVLGSGVTADGVHYVVTEHCGGGSLADRLASGEAWAVADVLRLADDVAGALDAAHAAGVLHRDLTPESIQLDDEGSAKLGGFGVAAVDGGQATAAMSFTPVHTAPEVVEGKEPSEATDIYQLASVLFTLLEGRPPFGDRHDGTMTVLNRILSDPVPPLTDADADPAINEVLARAMAKDPAARQTHASALAADLRAAVSEAPAPPAPPPPAAPPPPPVPPPATPPVPAPPVPAPPVPAPPVPTAPVPAPPVPAPPVPTAPIHAAPAMVPPLPTAPADPKGASRSSLVALILVLVLVAVAAAVITLLVVS